MTEERVPVMTKVEFVVGCSCESLVDRNQSSVTWIVKIKGTYREVAGGMVGNNVVKINQVHIPQSITHKETRKHTYICTYICSLCTVCPHRLSHSTKYIRNMHT